MAVKLCKTWAAILSCRSHCNIILVSVCRWRWQNCCNATDPEVLLSLSQSLNLLSSIETASGDNDATGAQTAGDQVLIKNFGRVYRRGTRAIGRSRCQSYIHADWRPTTRAPALRPFALLPTWSHPSQTSVLFRARSTIMPAQLVSISPVRPFSLQPGQGRSPSMPAR